MLLQAAPGWLQDFKVGHEFALISSNTKRKLYHQIEHVKNFFLSAQ